MVLRFGCGKHLVYPGFFENRFLDVFLIADDWEGSFIWEVATRSDQSGGSTPGILHSFDLFRMGSCNQFWFLFELF